MAMTPVTVEVVQLQTWTSSPTPPTEQLNHALVSWLTGTPLTKVLRIRLLHSLYVVRLLPRGTVYLVRLRRRP